MLLASWAARHPIGIRWAVVGLLGWDSVLGSGSASAAGQGGVSSRVDARTLGAAIATSSVLHGAVRQVRVLTGGKLLANDVVSRRVVMYDSLLNVLRVVADSASGTPDSYGPVPAGLIASTGDTTLLVIPASLSALVLDGTGHVVRVRAVPFADEVGRLIAGPNGTPAFDRDGRLVVRGFGGGRGRTAERGVIAELTTPDSFPLVRVSWESRQLDTIATVKAEVASTQVVRHTDGAVATIERIRPLQATDTWAVLSSGRVAVIRGHDYRFERYDSPGKAAVSQPIPFRWFAVPDSMKSALIDSIRMATDLADSVRKTAIERGMQPGTVPMQFYGARVLPTEKVLVPADSLPDFAPPFYPGAALADDRDRVWIRTSLAIAGEAIYDVVTAEGQLVDRIKVAAAAVILAVADGRAYLAQRYADGVRLTVAHLGR